ncbi:hypothetical protein HHI36_013758 [Cryptolaemus montrouzieri]|uniref:THAP-type domain-containing protein n=1 Tax=Cryptolaemus montrouzieri TaxID=559131 RepID=A0ABD2NIA1_9CUCU
MPCCSAINCSNRDSRDTKKVSLFRFPADKTRREKWIQNTCRLSWTPTSSSRLCEEHFEESQFESKRADNVRKLKPNAVPTLFDVPNSPTRIDPIPRKSLYQVFYNPEMGGSYCAVNGCWGSKESKHRFPNPKNDIQLFQRWVAVCCNENLLRKTPEQVYNNSRVCKLHFLTSDFGPNNKLKKNSIPSLNMPALDEKRLNESIVSDVKLSQREDTVILPSPCIDPEEVSIGEILRVCRTCLKIVKRQDTVSLVPYNSNNNTELYKKLTELLGLDLLPVANPCVCKDCENFINAVHDFREACHANEMVLKEFDWGSKPKDLLHIVDQDAVKKVYSECCLGPKDIHSDSVIEKDIAPSTQETIIIEPDLVNNLTKEGKRSISKTAGTL